MNKKPISVYVLDNLETRTAEVNGETKSIVVGDYTVSTGEHHSCSKKVYKVRLSHKVRIWIEKDYRRSATKNLSGRGKEPYLRFGQVYVGTKFKSTMTSRVLSDCPFRLDKYTPEPGSDMPINFKLSFIDEGNTFSETITDDFDRESTELKYGRNPRSKWKRIEKHTLTGKMSEQPEDFRIGLELATKDSK